MLPGMPSKVLALLVALLMPTAAVQVASAKGDDDGVSASGSCTGSATSKLKAEKDDGMIEVEFEVDQNRNGVSWTVVLRRNGKQVHKSTRKTKAPSGSFDVERKIADPAGTDTITARATNRAGQVCTARVRI